MKTIAFLSAIFMSVTAVCQVNQEVPNHEFEGWNSNTDPKDWSTLEDVVGPGNGIVKQETNDVQNGSAALYLETPMPSGYVNYSIVSLGNMFYNSTIHKLVSTGTSYHSRPDSAWVLYKYVTPAADSAGVAISMQAADANGNPETVLNVLFPLLPSGSWQLKAYKLSSHYKSAKQPDSAYVSFISSANKARTPGSMLLVDGIYFNNPSLSTNLKETVNKGGLKVYPNPANDGYVRFDTHEELSGYRFELIGVDGKKVLESGIGQDNSVELSRDLTGNFFWLLISPEDKVAGKGSIIINP